MPEPLSPMMVLPLVSCAPGAIERLPLEPAGLANHNREAEAAELTVAVPPLLISTKWLLVGTLIGFQLSRSSQLPEPAFHMSTVWAQISSLATLQPRITTRRRTSR